MPPAPARPGEDAWRAVLSPEEYRVLRSGGTDAVGKGEYVNFFPAAGHFACRGCSAPLYQAASKIAGGWPAFERALSQNVEAVPARRRAPRELRCATCGGHLGHVFQRRHEAHQRHCVNSTSIQFVNSAVALAEGHV
ncbi:Peptide methionine sulfoxide reductase B3 [Diplonema papillatum]|nr:Peptide methionine sulfoxide reductase B3 [Diplonema papillatum]|eukprot:gene18188-28023_t